MNRIKFKTGIFTFLLTFIFLSFFSIYVNAQVNTEKYRASSKGEGFGGNLDLSLSWYKGNTDLIAADAELGLYYNRRKNQFSLRGILKYGEKSKQSYINMGFIHLRGIRKFSERVMIEAFLQKEFNKFILLNSRNLAGSGMRFAVCKSEPGDAEKKKKLFAIYLGVGFIWEEEKFSPAEDGTQKEDTSLLKSGNYLSLSYNAGTAELGIISYFQFNVKEIAAFRNFSDLYFKFKISSHLSYKTKINFRFDNRPPETVEKYDIQVSNGLSIEF